VSQFDWSERSGAKTQHTGVCDLPASVWPPKLKGMARMHGSW
jgi:hypothetical protein